MSCRYYFAVTSAPGALHSWQAPEYAVAPSSHGSLRLSEVSVSVGGGGGGGGMVLGSVGGMVLDSVGSVVLILLHIDVSLCVAASQEQCQYGIQKI